MKKKVLIVLCLLLTTIGVSWGQTINLDAMDIVLHDTLISKTDFVEKGQQLPPARLAALEFRPPTDGPRTIYYLNGQVYAQGELKDKREQGVWTYWHANGQKAREGRFTGGRREGTHRYWYATGQVRSVGHFKNDQFEGTWTLYPEDGTAVVEQRYKNGKLVSPN